MDLIIGRKPVLEAINSGEEIEQVYVQYGQRGEIITAIQTAAKKRKIKCNLVSIERFRKLTRNPHSQGVAAKIPEFRYSTLEEVIANSKKNIYPLLLVLDSIQDPRNVGAILRTAECSNVGGIILTKHNSASINETVVKTSAGAAEHLKICLINNLSNTIKELKDSQFWIIGSSLENSDEGKPLKNYNELDYKMPVALIIGNEEQGIRRITAQNCDILVKIPMLGKIQSLNVSVASGILLFEILRQRKS
jgi:23S rRNA (guanosine2251-2'-O)-methyltransferase